METDRYVVLPWSTVGIEIRQTRRIYSHIRLCVTLQCYVKSGVLNPHSLLFGHYTPCQGVHALSFTPSCPTVDCHLFTPQLLAFVTDELSIRVGQTLAGLINVTLVRTSFRLEFSYPRILRLTKRGFLQGNA